jgi:membrane associated rhomboid family serine protease
MDVLATRDTDWMRQCEAALLAESISVQWQPCRPSGVMLLDVPLSEAERAAEILSDQLGEELRRGSVRGGVSSVAHGPLWARPAFAFGLGMAALTLVFFWISGGTAGASLWHDRGAFVATGISDGQWWRLVTASTLHADARHAVGNASFFVALGWAAAERVGVGVALLVWLVTAVCGYCVSLTLSDVQLSVGASGGLYGLLGAAAGHGLRHSAVGPLGRRRHMRVLGAAILLVAYTAFSPRANISAHLGGFLAGLACGVVSPGRALPGAAQALLAAAATAVLLVAWRFALAVASAV